MEFTLTLEEVFEQTHADDRAKWDLTVPYEELNLAGGRLQLPEERLAAGSTDAEPRPALLTPTPWALSQLCERLRIPVSYFKRCPPHLQEWQANYWLEQLVREEQRANAKKARESEPKNWLLRCKGETLRGILSERYAKLDNAQVLTSLVPLLEARFQVGWFSLSSESLHLRLVDPRLGREVLPGDRLFVGIHVANSEVGKRAVTVDAMVFRLVCTNGLIRLVKGKSLLHQRHLFLSAPHFEEALRQAIGEALTVAAGFLEQIVWSTRTPIKDVEVALKSLARQWSLSDTLVAQVKVALLRERPSQQETLYGLVQALTQTAQTLPPDERYHLEALTGRLIEPGPLTLSRLRAAGSQHTDNGAGSYGPREVLDLIA